MSNGRKMKAEQLYEIVMDKMDLTRDIGDEELMELIHQVIREAAEEEYGIFRFFMCVCFGRVDRLLYFMDGEPEAAQ